MKMNTVCNLVAISLATVCRLGTENPVLADTCIEETHPSNETVGPGVKEYGYTTTTTVIPDQTVILEKPVVLEKQVMVEKAPVVSHHLKLKRKLSRVNEKPVLINRVVEKPIVIQRPVIIEKVFEKPVVVDRVIERPVYVEKRVDQGPILIERQVDVTEPVVIIHNHDDD
jgi:hypothetical protein